MLCTNPLDASRSLLLLYVFVVVEVWKAKWGEVKPRKLQLNSEEQKKLAKDEEDELLEGTDVRTRVEIAAGKVRVEAKRAGYFKAVWSSKGTMSRLKMSVWSPNMSANSNSKINVCIGHFAVKGWSKPGRNDDRYCKN